jgi:hypothetical protein
MTVSQGGWLLKLLQDLQRVFPLDQAGCSPQFKGTHHITLGKVFPDLPSVEINIWWAGVCTPITVDKDELDHADLTVLLLEIKSLIEGKQSSPSATAVVNPSQE